MARTTLAGPRGRLVIERDITPVHYLSDIDPHWAYTDKAGHRHHCEYDAEDRYPTLARVAEETYWCADCGDEHETAHLECRLCGEEIRPGTTGPGTKYLQGPVTYLLNGQPATREDAEAYIAEWQAAGG